MKGTKIFRELEAAKRDRANGRYREMVEMSFGRNVLCESRSERDFWENYREALATKQLSTREFSIRDFFEAFVANGREMVESWNPKWGPDAGVKWQEAAGAVTSSDFSNITGPVIYTMMLENLPPEETVFQNLIPTQPTQFNGERIPGITGLGDAAEIVPENKEYPLVGIGEDWIDTPPTLKRGLIVPLTKDALFFDRTNKIREEASAVGQSLTLGKEKRAIDCIIDENTTTHRYKWRGTTYATYQTTTPWDNVTASNALVDWTDLDNIEQTQNALVDPHTGEPVAVESTHLFVTKSLQSTARRVTATSQITVVTPGYATSANPTAVTTNVPVKVDYNIVSTRLMATRLATDTDYFVGNPSKYAVYMENWPITVTEAGMGSYDEFRRDIVMQFKASERGQYAVIQPRAMGKATVA